MKSKNGKKVNVALFVGIIMLAMLSCAFVNAAVIFSDDFNDGNSSGWAVQYGTWSVVSDGGSYVYYKSGTDEGRSSAGSSSWTNYSVQARVKVDSFNGSNRAYVCGRYKDGNNFYAASLTNNSSGGALEIRKKVSGSSSTLVSKSFGLSAGTWYTVKLELSGTSIKMYLNGTLQLSATDSSLSSGGIGLVPYKVTAKYDDVVVDSSTGGGTTPAPTQRPGATPTPTRRGAPTATPIQGGGGTKYINSTIVVPAGQTYDGGGQTIIAQGMGDGGQGEDQQPIFKLENGATLRNVIIGFPACDGVHCYGNNNVYNVRWPDVGEDALTVKGGESANVGTINVDGGYANKADDKVFQVNAPCTLRISNFSADTMGKLVRQNGGTTFTMNLYLTNVSLNNVKEAVFRTDSSSSRCYYRNLTVTNFNGSKGWWYGRDSQAQPY